MSSLSPRMPPVITIVAPKAIQIGKNQLFSISTACLGQPEDMDRIRATLISPDAKMQDLRLTHMSRGEYQTMCSPPKTGAWVIAINVTSRDRLSSQQSFAFNVQLLPPTSGAATASPQPQQLVQQPVHQQQQIPSNLPALNNWDPHLWVNREVHDYIVEKELQTGGTGFVLAAKSKFNNREVAVKIPKLRVGSSDTSKELGEMLSEASNLQTVSRQSPYIVQLHGVHGDTAMLEEMISRNDTLLYLRSPPMMIMEFMKGGDAKQLLSDDTLFYSSKWKEIVSQVVVKIAKALDAIHKEGYVHLDVKPQNILFNTKPPSTGGEMLEQLKSGQLVPKLTDLGSAVKIGKKFEQFTPEYAPAQQILAWTGIGVASKDMDVYALGATMYMMMTNTPLNSTGLINSINRVFDAKVQTLKDPNSKGATEDLHHAIEEMRNEWNKSTPDFEAIDQRYSPLLRVMTSKHPNDRPNAEMVASSLSQLLN